MGCDSHNAVLSDSSWDCEGGIAESCITCKTFLNAANQIVRKSIENHGHGLRVEKEMHETSFVANLGRLVDIFTESSCEDHKGFIRSAFGYILHRDGLDDTTLGINWCENRGLANLTLYTPQCFMPHDFVLLDSELDDPGLSCMGRLRNDDFISIDMMKNWISTCEQNHTRTCCIQTQPSTPLSWMIDTRSGCLVPAEKGIRYVALSYVWGQTEMLKATTDTISVLQCAGALGATTHLKVPQVIRHVVALVPQLGERYLWVDSLCIMQDDAQCLERHIRHMASIYEAALFTIVAADGPDANHGIPGIRGVSAARTLIPSLQLTSRLSLRVRGSVNILHSAWGTRAWTLQEHLFSRRKLTFFNGSVQWTCQECRLFEDVYQEFTSRPSNGWSDYIMYEGLKGLGELSLNYPAVSQIEYLFHDYTERKLTFGTDALRAVEAIFTAYRMAFPSGFFLGLPLDFFDLALLWCHWEEGATRRPAVPPSKNSPFPSWTWAGWVGRLKLGAWRSATYIKDADEPCWQGKRCLTIPMLEWRYRTEDKASSFLVPGQNSANAFRQKFMGKASDLPHGWKYEDESLGPMPSDTWSWFDAIESNNWGLQTPYYYSHEAAPGVKFWHPVPILPDPPSDTLALIDGHLLCAETQSGHLWVTGVKDDIPGAEKLAYPDQAMEVRLFSGTITVKTVLLDEKGEIVGDLYINDGDDRDIVKNYKCQPNEAGYPCELVAVSKGNDFVHPMELGKEQYTFYNVLWVKWEAGIAYRRGVGRVKRETWESMELENIDLILG